MIAGPKWGLGPEKVLGAKNWKIAIGAYSSELISPERKRICDKAQTMTLDISCAVAINNDEADCDDKADDCDESQTMTVDNTSEAVGNDETSHKEGEILPTVEEHSLTSTTLNIEQPLTENPQKQGISTAGDEFAVVGIIGIRLVNQQSVDGVISANIDFDDNCSDVVQVIVPSSLTDTCSNANTTQNVCQYLRSCSSALTPEHLGSATDNIQHACFGGDSNNSTTLSNQVTCEITPSVMKSVQVKTRKRKRNPEKLKKSQKKLLRNTGQEYVSSSGQVCEARRVGPRCSCRKQKSMMLSHCVYTCHQSIMDSTAISLLTT